MPSGADSVDAAQTHVDNRYRGKTEKAPLKKNLDQSKPMARVPDLQLKPPPKTESIESIPLATIDQLQKLEDELMEHCKMKDVQEANDVYKVIKFRNENLAEYLKMKCKTQYQIEVWP